MCTEACKPNNVTDHRQAMTDAVRQQAATEEQDSSDEQQPVDDDIASLDNVEVPREDLWSDV